MIRTRPASKTRYKKARWCKNEGCNLIVYDQGEDTCRSCRAYEKEIKR